MGDHYKKSDKATEDCSDEVHAIAGVSGLHHAVDGFGAHRRIVRSVVESGAHAAHRGSLQPPRVFAVGCHLLLGAMEHAVEHACCS